MPRLAVCCIVSISMKACGPRYCHLTAHSEGERGMGEFAFGERNYRVTAQATPFVPRGRGSYERIACGPRYCRVTAHARGDGRGRRRRIFEDTTWGPRYCRVTRHARGGGRGRRKRVFENTTCGPRYCRLTAHARGGGRGRREGGGRSRRRERRVRSGREGGGSRRRRRREERGVLNFIVSPRARHLVRRNVGLGDDHPQDGEDKDDDWRGGQEGGDVGRHPANARQLTRQVEYFQRGLPKAKTRVEMSGECNRD